MDTITISRKFAPRANPVTVSKNGFGGLIARARDVVTEQIVLQWSLDAKNMHRAKKLTKLI